MKNSPNIKEKLKEIDEEYIGEMSFEMRGVPCSIVAAKRKDAFAPYTLRGMIGEEVLEGFRAFYDMEAAEGFSRRLISFFQRV